ncbi:MAG: prolipoprotein diacylglyceryl transferase [Aristaeellaceae bacterium]
MPATPVSRYIIGALPWYSVLIVAGICAALFVASREEKRLGLPRDTTVDLSLWVIPFGIAGARLYYVAFAWDVFKSDPVSILKIWQGGLAIYGGIIGGFLAGVLFCRRRHLPMTKIMDMVAPALPLAQAIGRWGNYFNMEAYGAPITNPAWQFFPVGVLIPSAAGGTWHMATFFYESVWDLAIFLTLMATRRRMRRSGDMFLWYVALYGAGRYVIEGFREDSLMLGSLRVSQLLSLGLCVAAFIILALRVIHLHRSRTAAALAAIVLLLALIPVGCMLLPGAGGSAWALFPPLCLLLASLFLYRLIQPAATEV